MKGVEIACKGDTFFLNGEKFIPIEVPTNHPIFVKECYYPKGAVKGEVIQVWMRQVCPDPTWRDPVLARRPGDKPFQNFVATGLALIANTWGIAPGSFPENMLMWSKIIGRLLVVRQDLVDITPHHVAHYSRFEIPSAMDQHRSRTFDSEVEKNIDRRKTGDMICKDYFEEFFGNFKRLRIEEGDSSWKDGISP